MIRSRARDRRPSAAGGTPRAQAVVLLGLVLVLATGAPAGAQTDEPGASPSPSPSPGLYAPYPAYGYIPDPGPQVPAFAGSGADALIRAPDLRGSDEPTFYERYGSQGYGLSDSRPTFGQSNDSGMNAIAAMIFGAAVWLAQTVIAVFQWAFALELFDFLGDAVERVVGGLAGTVYVPFIETAVILAGLWAIWHGLVRKRGTHASEGLLWTVLALAVGALFLAHPAAVINGANQFSTGFARVVLAGVSVADPQLHPDDGTTATPTFSGGPADTELRLAADRFWRVFVHLPWTVLQLGDTEAGRMHGEALLAARTVTTDEQAALALAEDPQAALTDLVTAKQEAAAELETQFTSDPRVAAWYGGDRAVERVGIASLTLGGVAAGGAVLGVLAAAILLAQIALVLLVLLGPFILLVGIHPGIGRLIAIRWAELLAGLVLKRVALSAVLAVVLVLNGVLAAAAYPLGWLVAMGLQALVVVAAVVYRKPFARLFAPATVPSAGAAVLRAGGALSGQVSRRTDRLRGQGADAAAQGRAGRPAPARGLRPLRPAGPVQSAGSASGAAGALRSPSPVRASPEDGPRSGAPAVPLRRHRQRPGRLRPSSRPATGPLDGKALESPRPGVPERPPAPARVPAQPEEAVAETAAATGDTGGEQR